MNNIKYEYANNEILNVNYNISNDILKKNDKELNLGIYFVLNTKHKKAVPIVLCLKIKQNFISLL